MKAAKDAGEEYYDLDRKDNILGRNKTRLELWKEHLKDPTVALDNSLKFVKHSCWRIFGPRILGRDRPPMAGVDFLQSLWEEPIWEGVWPHLDPRDSVCLRTASVEWKVPGKYGPRGELFFFLTQKELAFGPFFKADIRTSLFSGPEEVCAYRLAHNRGREKAERMGVMPLIWEANGKWAAQRFQFRRVRVELV